MIREVDLVSYLPPFIAGYKETSLTLAAENPEFDLAWKAADRALKNEFIATADEYGISRFEKILGIYPADTDTIEDRRMKVQNRWFNATPYTIRMLAVKMTELLGDAHCFSIGADFEEAYGLKVTVHNTEDPRFDNSHMENIRYLMEVMVPLNIRCWLNDRVLMDISVEAQNQAALRNIRFQTAIPFLPARTYDGSSRYDGSARYDAKRHYELGMRMRICLDAGGPEGDIGNMAVETRRDVNYYDGKIRYDGSVRYDAMIRKDVIE